MDFAFDWVISKGPKTGIVLCSWDRKNTEDSIMEAEVA